MKWGCLAAVMVCWFCLFAFKQDDLHSGVLALMSMIWLVGFFILSKLDELKKS